MTAAEPAAGGRTSHALYGAADGRWALVQYPAGQHIPLQYGQLLYLGRPHEVLFAAECMLAEQHEPPGRLADICGYDVPFEYSQQWPLLNDRAWQPFVQWAFHNGLHQQRTLWAEYAETFGEHMSSLRLRAGISQQKAVEVARIGQPTLSRIERDQKTPDLAVFTRLCDLYEVPVEHRLGLLQLAETSRHLREQQRHAAKHHQETPR